MFVNVKFVNLPGPQSSGKYGSIVTVEGTKVMVPADMLGMFRSGMQCEIGTKEQTWGSTPVIVATSGPGGAAQAQPYRPSMHGTPNRETGQRANTASFQPRVYQGGGQQTGNAQATDQGRHIFVTGTVGRAMGSGKFAASELAVLTAEACRAYDTVLAKPAPPTPPEPAPGFNDDVADL